MSDAVDRATVEIIANVASYIDGLKQAEHSTTAFAAKTSKEVGGLSEQFQRLAGYIAAGFAIHKIVEVGKAAIDTADEISKLSQKVGISTESLSAYRHMADLSDVSNQKLQVGIVKLSKNLGEAAAGSVQQVAAFNALGISQSFLAKNSNDTDVVLKEVITRFGQYADGATKTRLAVDLFGKAGADMIPLLNGGAQGLAEATAEAKKFGLIIGAETGKAAEQFNDNLTRMHKLIDGLANQVIAKIIPKMAEMTDKLVAWAAENDVVTKSATAIANAIAFVADHIGEIIAVAKLWIGLGLIGYFGDLVTKTAAWTIALVENAIAARAAASAAAEMGMATQTSVASSIKQIGLLNAAVGGSQAAFVGWQIGTYLRNEFGIVAQAGDAMIGLLLIGWEKLKQGGQLAWMQLKVFVQDYKNSVLEAAASTVDFASKLAKLNPLTPQALIDKYAALSKGIREGTESTEGLRVKMSLLTNSTNANVAAIQKNIKEQIAWDGSTHEVAKGVQELAPLLVSGGKKLLDYGANAAEAKKNTEDFAKILSQIKQIAAAAAGEIGGPLGQALAKYNVAKEKTLQLEREGIALGKDNVAIHAATVDAINKLTAAYNAETAAIQKKQQIGAQHILALKEEIRLAGLSTKEQQVQREVMEALTQAKSEHVDLNGRFIASEEELTRVLGEQRPAFEEQIRQLQATKAAIDQQVSQWHKYSDIVRGAYDSMIQKSVEWAMSGFKNTKEFMHNMLNLVKSTVTQMLVEWAKTKVIGWFTGGGGGGGGGGWFGLAAAGAAAIGGSSGSGSSSGGGTSPTGGYNYAGASGQGGGGGFGSLLNYGSQASSLSGGSAFGGAGGAWLNANPGLVGTTAAYGGALAGAYYGSQQGDGGIGTVGSTAAGAIAGYYAGTVAAGALLGASGAVAAGGTAAAGASAGAIGAAGAVPIIGWIALIALVVDKVTGGKIFGSKWAPSSSTLTAGFGADGSEASQSVNLWKYRSQASQAFGRFGGAVLPSDWGDKDKKTKDLPVDPKILAELEKIQTAYAKTYVDAAKAISGKVVPMLDATFQTITHYDKHGKVDKKKTEYIGTILDKTYKEPFEEFIKRMNAEAIIATVNKMSAGVSAAVDKFRGSADGLLDAASVVLQAQVDINKGRMLLGSGDTASSTLAWVDSLRVGDEKLIQTYARLSQASQQYHAIMEQVADGFKKLETATPVSQMKTALDALNKQLVDNIAALTAAAEAAGLSAAAEKDLARVRELNVAQIEKMHTDFIANIQGQIDALNLVHTPSGDFSRAMTAIGQNMRDNIAQADLLAKAQGKAGASAAELGKIYSLAAAQAAAAIASLKAIGMDQVRSLYGGAYTLAQVNTDIAALEARASSATSSIAGFGDAIATASTQATDAINLLLGSLSPLNDQEKLNVALSGLQQGTVGKEQVLEIGRRLYATSQQYTNLFNMVQAMGNNGPGAGNDNGARQYGSSSSEQHNMLSAEDQQRLKDLMLQREAMLKDQRIAEARELANTVATLGKAEGIAFDAVANELHFSLAQLAKDLGMSDTELQAYLTRIQQQQDIIPDTITTNTDRIIATLVGLFGPKPEFGALGGDGKPTGVLDPIEPIRAFIRDSGQKQIDNTDRTATAAEDTTRAIRDMVAELREALGMTQTRNSRMGETGIMRR